MKKLTLFKGKAMACLVLMCLFLAQGCKKDLLQPNSGVLQNSLSFAEARQYFDANLKQISKSKKLMGVPDGLSGAGTTTIEDILYNKQPVWDKAYQKLISTGTAVKIPIDFGEVRKMVDEQKKTYMPYSALNYLLMYKDSLQQVHAEWVYLKPTLSWLNGDRASYQGSIFIKDWNGKTLKVYNYGSGKISQDNKISAVKGALMGGRPTTPLKDGCLIWPVKTKCNCPWAWPAGVGTGQWNPDKCDYCDGCVDYFCMIEPECGGCPPPPDWGGGGSSSGNSGTGGEGPSGNGYSGGGGSHGDYPPENCTNGPEVTYPDGSMTPPPCTPEPTLVPNDPGGSDPNFISDNATVFDTESGNTYTYGYIRELFEANPGLVDDIEAESDLPIITVPFYSLFKTQEVFQEYKALKYLHPYWTNGRIGSTALYNVMSGDFHFFLDLGGLVPLVGEPLDIVNGAIYFLEGNHIDAALSVGAAIPVWGWTATGGKWVKNITKIISKPISSAIGKLAYRAVKTSRGGYRFIKVAVGAFSHTAITILHAVKPADKTLTNLSRSLIDQAAHRISPVAQSLKSKVDDIILHLDLDGKKTEQICDEIFETDGFVKYEAKLGSNNGFDGLYIKKDASGNVDEILINEAKQVGVMGNIKLNAANPQTGLNAQMSDAWISDVIGNLKTNSNTSTLGNTLENLFQNNRNLFTKTVTGVDRSSGEIIIIKLEKY